MLPDLLFLLFAAGLVMGAGLIVAARNPMVGVMGMLVAFLNASGMFILFGAEFLGLLLIMVYVGAVAVMFLFVLMTMDVEQLILRTQVRRQLPLGLAIVAVLAAEIMLAARFGLFSATVLPLSTQPQPHNIVALGRVLFTDYVLPFQVAGLVLLTAMVGAIVLAHRPRTGVKRQNISQQVLRRKEEGLVITQPAIGAGATPRHFQPKPVDKKI